MIFLHNMPYIVSYVMCLIFVRPFKDRLVKRSDLVLWEDLEGAGGEGGGRGDRVGEDM